MKHLMSIFLFFYCFLVQASEIEYHVKVGNKIFGNNDLKGLMQEHKRDLIDISNPPCYLRAVGISNSVLTPLSVDKLRGMPKRIKEGMVIQRCSYDKIIDDTRVERCLDATTCSSVAAPFVEGFVWIATGCNISNSTLWGLVCGWAGAAAAPCLVCSVHSCCEMCCCKNVREEITIQ